MEDILRITDPILADDSIYEYEYKEYNPISGTNLDRGSIVINIEAQDAYTHSSESYLIIEGRLTKNDVGSTSYGDNDVITLINNGMMYLFSDVRYYLASHEIEVLQNPGHATTMLGLLKYPDDFSKSQGLNQLWYKDIARNAILDIANVGFYIRHNYIINSPDPNGTFSLRIPLKHFFGFCQDYTKVIYGMQQKLTLTRDNNNNAIFRAAAVDEGKIMIEKISWFMPHVIPSDENKYKIEKIIEKKEKLPVGYRMLQCDNTQVSQTTDFTWRLGVKSSPDVPRFIIVGFQTGKNNDQTKNPAIFDHVSVRNIYVTLNAKRYPDVNYEISFTNNQFSRIYGDTSLFRSKFFNMDELISNPNINPSDFKSLYPLFLFDVSKQSDKLKHSVSDIHIKATFDVNVPANTIAYAVVISDRIIEFVSDGNKISNII